MQNLLKDTEKVSMFRVLTYARHYVQLVQDVAHSATSDTDQQFDAADFVNLAEELDQIAWSMRDMTIAEFRELSKRA